MDSILEVKELEAIKGHRICDDPFHSRDRIEARQTNLYHLQLSQRFLHFLPFFSPKNFRISCQRQFLVSLAYFSSASSASRRSRSSRPVRSSWFFRMSLRLIAKS